MATRKKEVVVWNERRKVYMRQTQLVQRSVYQKNNEMENASWKSLICPRMTVISSPEFVMNLFVNIWGRIYNYCVLSIHHISNSYIAGTFSRHYSHILTWHLVFFPLFQWCPCISCSCSPYFFPLLLHHSQSEKSHMTFERYKPRHEAETSGVIFRRGLGGAGQMGMQDKAKGQGLMKCQTVADKYVRQQEILFIDNVSFTSCHYLHLPGSWKRLLACVFKNVL